MARPHAHSPVNKHEPELAEDLRSLRDHGNFAMPSSWDAGSKKVMAAGGFAAIGPTSGA
ncbi:MAG: hypothetical protein ACKVIQ_03850 [Acidimicrobiales bacterium]